MSNAEIRHGKWLIFFSDNPLGLSQFRYAYVHDDFDGADDAMDDRHGYARTVEEAKAEIDAYEEEHKDDDK